MKKYLFILLINFIIILDISPSFAVAPGGYSPGPLGIGVNMTGVKPFEKQELKLYENEWAMVFSNANLGSYTTGDERYIKVIGEKIMGTDLIIFFTI